jgi:hypothetical protein
MFEPIARARGLPALALFVAAVLVCAATRAKYGGPLDGGGVLGDRPGHVDIVGIHGDPLFVAAARVAEVLLRAGAVQSVSLRRCGQRRVPEWDSPPDTAPFYALAKREQWRTTLSPRIVVDGATAIDADTFVRQMVPLLLRHGGTRLEAPIDRLIGRALTANLTNLTNLTLTLRGPTS